MAVTLWQSCLPLWWCHFSGSYHVVVPPQWQGPWRGATSVADDGTMVWLRSLAMTIECLCDSERWAIIWQCQSHNHVMRLLDTMWNFVTLRNIMCDTMWHYVTLLHCGTGRHYMGVEATLAAHWGCSLFRDTGESSLLRRSQRGGWWTW